MPVITLTETVNAPIREVWDSWDDFGDIYKFNPNLSGSFTLDGTPSSGKGAGRQCDMKNGKDYLRERVIEHVPERRLVVDIYEASMPIERALATFEFAPKGPNRTQVTMTMDYVPQGIMGRIMTPLMKPMFARLLGKLLRGNKDFVERGITVAQAA